ncbi:MAG: hypothetical protein R3F34_08720 [Planctomycetota bacterium]
MIEPDEWVEPIEVTVAVRNGLVVRVVDTAGHVLEGIHVAHVVGDQRLPRVVERAVTGPNGLAAFTRASTCPTAATNATPCASRGCSRSPSSAPSSSIRSTDGSSSSCARRSAASSPTSWATRRSRRDSQVCSCTTRTRAASACDCPRRSGLDGAATPQLVRDRTLRWHHVGVGIPLALHVGLYEGESVEVGVEAPQHAGEVVRVRVESWPLGAAVRGRLVLAGGAPLADAAFTVEHHDGDRLGLFDVEPGRADAQGRFVLWRPTDGGADALVCTAHGCASDPLEIGTPVDGGTVDLGDVVLRDRSERTGVLVTGHRGPLGGALVHAWVEVRVDELASGAEGVPDVERRGPTASIPQPAPGCAWTPVAGGPFATDDAGRTVFAHRSGATRAFVLASHPAHSTESAVAALPRSLVAIDLAGTGRLAGRLVVPSPLEPNGVVLRFVDAVSDEVLETVRAEASGRFVASPLPLRPLLVRAMLGDRFVVAESGPIVPLLRGEGDHPALSPLDLTPFLAVCELHVVAPPADDAAPSDPRLQVEVRAGGDGEVLWQSAGPSEGPWDVVLALPAAFDRRLVVAATGCVPQDDVRPEPYVSVQLERGPRLELEVRAPQDFPAGGKILVTLRAEGDAPLFAHRTAEVGADGLCRFDLARPGKVTVVARAALVPEGSPPFLDAEGAVLAREIEVPAEGARVVIELSRYGEAEGAEAGAPFFF